MAELMKKDFEDEEFMSKFKKDFDMIMEEYRQGIPAVLICNLLRENDYSELEIIQRITKKIKWIEEDTIYFHLKQLQNQGVIKSYNQTYDEKRIKKYTLI